MKSQFNKYARGVIFSCAIVMAFVAVVIVHAQTAANVQTLRDQLRPRYDIVALQDGVALVPRQRQADIRIVEVRNGAVAINGVTLSAQEARQRLGSDADAILRITYLDSAAQHELARPDSAAPTAPDNAAQSPSPTRTQTHGGDLVHIGGDVTVDRDEVIQGNVVAIGGSANIDGEVAHDVSVVGGSLTLGPDAVVHGNVVVVGGSLDRSPGARIDGKVDNVAFGARFPFNQSFNRNRSFFARRPLSRAGTFFLTLSRVILLILTTLVVAVLGGHFVDAIADRSAAEPLRAGLTGLVAEILFVPLLVITAVVLAVSIIGIPLLILIPFALVLAVLLMVIGFTGIARQVGRLLGKRFNIAHGPYSSVVLGVLAVVATVLLGRLVGLTGIFGIGALLVAIGLVLEYIAWTMGIGALILTWLGTRHHSLPAASAPPGPTPAPAGPHAG